MSTANTPTLSSCYKQKETEMRKQQKFVVPKKAIFINATTTTNSTAGTTHANGDFHKLFENDQYEDSRVHGCTLCCIFRKPLARLA